MSPSLRLAAITAEHTFTFDTSTSWSGKAGTGRCSCGGWSYGVSSQWLALFEFRAHLAPLGLSYDQTHLVTP